MFMSQGVLNGANPGSKPIPVPKLPPIDKKRLYFLSQNRYNSPKYEERHPP